MIILVSYSYLNYLSCFIFSFPKYILITLFCIITMIIYPLYIFNNKKTKIIGTIISIILITIISIICIINPPIYSTNIFGNSKENIFDNTYKVHLTDSKYGKVSIIYEKNIEDYFIHADFKKEGTTTMILESPTGEKVEYKVMIKRDTYRIKKKQNN